MISDKSRLVLRINELFHDIEQADYDDKHDDIFVDEKKRWERFGENFLKHNENAITVLDIGSGTGFVPMNLAQYLKAKDVFVCSDISQNILNVCKEKVERKKFYCNLKFVKTNGLEVDIPSESVDFITLNSVLHHIPDFTAFFKEANRLLKKNGMIVIGHEPNQLFFHDKLLWSNHKILDFIFNPRRVVLNISKKIGIFDLLRKLYLKASNKKGKHDELISKINKQLIEEKLIKNTLSGDEIFSLIDVHSPASKSHEKEKGFDITKLMEAYLPNFKIDYVETYNHLGKVSSRNSFFKKIDLFLRKKYPTKGSSFLVVFAKN